MSGGPLGYVYVMRSERSTELKIGFTLSSLEQRERELHSTGMASPLKAIYHVAVENPYAVEHEAHRKLADKRVSENREFFDCEPQEAIAAIRQAAEHLGKNILQEWHAESISSVPTAYDINVWTEKARPEVKLVIDDVLRDFERLRSKAAMLARMAPKEDCTDINEIFTWQKKAGKFRAESFVNHRGISKDQEIKIRFWCGAVPFHTTEKNFENLKKYLFDGELLKILTHKKLHEAFEKFRPKIKIIREQVIEKFNQSDEIMKLSERIKKLEAKFFEFENFFLSISNINSLSQEEFIKIYSIASNKFGWEQIKSLEIQLNNEINEIHELFDSDGVIWYVVASIIPEFGVSSENTPAFAEDVCHELRERKIEKWEEEIQERLNAIKEEQRYAFYAFSDFIDVMIKRQK